MLIEVLENNWKEFNGSIVIRITKNNLTQRTYKLISGAAFSRTKADFFRLVKIAERNGGTVAPRKNIRSIALRLWQETTNKYCLAGYENVIV